jgi:uncharacterized membrane protein
LTAVKARCRSAARLAAQQHRRSIMPTQSEIEAAARVLCRVAYYQMPAKERVCSADVWPDVDVPVNGAGPRGNASYKRWETFGHEARLALEAAEVARLKTG